MSYDNLLYEAYGYSLNEAKKLQTLDDLIGAAEKLHKDMQPYYGGNVLLSTKLGELAELLRRYRDGRSPKSHSTNTLNDIGREVESLHTIPAKLKNDLDQIRIVFANLPRRKN